MTFRKRASHRERALDADEILLVSGGDSLAKDSEVDQLSAASGDPEL